MSANLEENAGKRVVVYFKRGKKLFKNYLMSPINFDDTLLSGNHRPFFLPGKAALLI
jgi:hypothetical protein